MKNSSLLSRIFRKAETSSSSSYSRYREGQVENPSEAVPEEFGVTEELQEHVKGFTIQTFKEFPLPQLQGVEKSDPSPAVRQSNVRKDLTDWEERHATLVLSTVKEISNLRYVLCPRHLKENEFWTIYFMLVKTYIAPYEIRAIQKEKLKRMELEHEKSAEKHVYEMEMVEAKQIQSGTCKMEDEH